MFKRAVGTLMIVIGLIVISSAIYMKTKTHYVENKFINNYNKSITQSQNDHKIRKLATLPNIISGTVGILSIPKINLTVAVNEGTNDDTLRYAVGHFPKTAMPGESGNICIAGHRSYTYAEYFNRLNEINAGDDIIVKSKGRAFTYKVSKTEVVKPSQVSVLEQTKNATITLVTCTPIRVGTHRLIIKGTLVNSK